MRLLLRQSPPVLALIASDLGFHLGFYMLVPFLAGHLAKLGYGAASIGLVLGLRALGQHGLSLLGGVSADRWGPRRVIALGCLLRALSFFALGQVTDLTLITLALIASGAASALFRPAMSAYLSSEVRSERAEVFAAATVLNEVGSFAGPLLGMALLGAGFGLVCAVSGALFALAGGALWLLLPPKAEGLTPAARNLQSMGAALRNRRLWLFSAAVSSYFILFDQMYLLIPLEMARVTGSDRWTGALFATASALVVIGQLPVTRLCRRYSSPGTAIALGMALMGVSFLLPMSSSATPGPLLLSFTVVLLTLGTMVAFPFVREVIPSLARERDLGAHHGVFYTVAGLMAAAGNTLTGRLHDMDGGSEGRVGSWMLLATLGVSGGIAVYCLSRNGRLGVPSAPQAA